MRRALSGGVFACALGLLLPALAPAATLHVSAGGSDGGSGTAEDPFASIGRAARAAGTGDIVEVGPGTYRETVEIPAGAHDVSFRGARRFHTIVDGEGVRRYGFVGDDSSGVTIRGFAIRRQTEAGIYLRRATHPTVRDNRIDHVGAASSRYGTGIKIAFGSRANIAGNVVSELGPGAEAIGIWLLQTSRALVDDNTVYLVRKEGIRDWQGLDNRIRRNRVFLTWGGISLNTSTGSTVGGNWVYENTNGIVAKHISQQSVLAYWGLTNPRWSTIRANTVWDSSGFSLALGQSGEGVDYVAVRRNLFADAGLAYIQDIPEIRGPHVAVDGNGYAPLIGGRPTYFYKAGWDDSGTALAGFDEYRSRLGWDRHGRVLNPRLANPGKGNLDSPARVGAPRLTPAPVTWTPYPMVPVDSSSPGTESTLAHLADTADDNQFSYWLTNTGQNEYVTYDFGRRRTFDHLILTVYSHLDPRNVHGYRFDVSNDRTHWRKVLAGDNPDSDGSSYKYELRRPARGRYLRFTLVDTFCTTYVPRLGCGPYFVLSDLSAGTLSARHRPGRR